MKNIAKKIIIFLIIFIFIYLILKINMVYEVLKILFISFIIAYALNPLKNMLARRGCKEGLASLMCILFIIVFITVILSYVFPIIFKEAMKFENLNIDDIYTELKSNVKFLGKHNFISNIVEQNYVKLNNYFLDYLNNIFSEIMKIGDKILSLTMIPISTFYILVEMEDIKKRFLLLIKPIEYRVFIQNIISRVNKVLFKYIACQVLLSFLMFLATYAILYFLKIPHGFILALINGICNLIPYIGPIIGGIPAVILSLLISFKTALLCAGLYIVVQQIEGDLVSPKIIGNIINLHPLLIILLLFISGGLFGVMGMIIVIPLAIAIKNIYLDLNHYFF